MNTTLVLILSIILANSNSETVESSASWQLMEAAEFTPMAIDMDCSPNNDTTVFITEMSCYKSVEIDFPVIPPGFNSGPGESFEVTYAYGGINGSGILSDEVMGMVPDLTPVTTPISSPGPDHDTIVDFWIGTNTVTFQYTDEDDVEFTCSFTITVLDSVPPQWPTDDTIFVTGTCGEDDPFEVYKNSDFSVTAIDNCCAPKEIPPQLVSEENICGNSSIYTYWHITNDGSGDDITGMPSETPCLSASANDIPWYDTLVVVVTMEDIIPPVISGVPPDTTIACTDTIELPNLTAIDSCEGDLSSDQFSLVVESIPEICGNGEVNTIETYTWTVTDGCGNTATAVWTVSYENPDFDITVTGGGLICTDDIATLDAGSEGETYLWSTGDTTQAVTVDVDGTYTVTVTTALGCCAIGETAVAFGDEQILMPMGGTLTCDSSTVTVSSGIDSDVYSWSGPNGFVSNSAMPLVDTVGEYFVTVTSSEGCSGTGVAVVDIDTMPPDLQVFLGPVDCAEETVALIANSNTSDVKYFWTGPGGFTSDRADTSAKLAGSYEVMVVSPNGCTTTDAVIVDQDISRPVLEVQTRPAVDGGNGIAWIQITGGQEPYSIDWSTGADTDTVSGLELGKYSVTVTDQNDCSSSRDFFINPAATVCDLPVSGVSVNSSVQDTLDTGAPYVMYSEPCIEAALGFLPSEGSLFIRTFLFEKTAEQGELLLKVGSEGIGDPLAFIFTCELNSNYNSQICLASIADSGSLDLDPGFYYIAIIGEENEVFDLLIEEESNPITICKAPNSDLECGITVMGELSDFNRFDVGSGVYQGCYRGGRSYEGPESIYRFYVPRKSAVNIAFSGQSSMGVFLYDYQCTGRCLSAFETVDSSSATDQIVLNSGFYYLVIDQATDEDGKGFALTVNCQEISDSPWPDRRTTVCYDEESFHSILINPAEITLPEDILDPTGFVTLYFLNPEGNQKIGPGREFFLTDPTLDPLLAFADDENLADICGYLEGEPLRYRLRTGLDVIVEGTANYEDVDSVRFKIGNTNRIAEFTQRPGTIVSVTRVDPAQINDVPFDVTETRLSVQTNQDWVIDPLSYANTAWIDTAFVQGSSNPLLGSGNGTIVIRHSVNNTSDSRTASVDITFREYFELVTHTFTQTPDTTVSIDYIPGLESVYVYPNPADQVINIDISLDRTSDISAVMRDIMGRVVLNQVEKQGRDIQMQLDISGLTSGLYFVTIHANEGRLTKRIIVID